MQTSIEMAVKRLEFFKEHYKTPEEVCLGVWLATALGAVLFEDELCSYMGLPKDSTVHDFADALIEYATSLGWEERIIDKLAEDIKVAHAQAN
jgi:hypothetical protein